MHQNKLPEIALGTGVLLAVIFILIAAWGAWPDMRLPFLAAPKVEMKLGDDWQAITAQSTYPFRDIANHSTGYATDREPVNFVYADSAHRLELDNARTVYFQLENGRTTNIRVLEWGAPGDWETIQARVRALVAHVAAAGWTRADGKSLDESLAGRKAFYDEYNDFMNDQFLGSWYAGGARFDLSLYRTRSAAEAQLAETAANERFVINVSIVGND